jgi:hypothetical protein
MPKTIELTLLLTEKATQTVKAYPVMPGLYAHKSLYWGGWQLSHHSGYGVGCNAKTLKTVKAYAEQCQALYPMDWTLSAKKIMAIKKTGSQWVKAFQDLNNGLQPDTYNIDQEEERSLDRPFSNERLTWQGEPVPMPTYRQVRAWIMDAHQCEALDGSTVEPDGYSPDGAPSYLLALGLI